MPFPPANPWRSIEKIRKLFATSNEVHPLSEATISEELEDKAVDAASGNPDGKLQQHRPANTEVEEPQARAAVEEHRTDDLGTVDAEDERGVPVRHEEKLPAKTVKSRLLDIRLHLSWAPFVEMAAGLGVLTALNFLFFKNNLGFTDLNPHPFWLIIVPIAARYGAVPGYVVGALSALVYLALAALQTGSLFGVATLGTQAALDPVLFFLVGAALGELRESHKRAHKRLAKKYDELEADVQDLAQRYLAAVELSRELEQRIVTQTSTVTTLYQAAKTLEHLEMQDLSPSVLELITSFIEADACAIYLREQNRFVLKAGLPASVPFERPQELDTGRGLQAIVVRERRTATVREIIAEATPARIREMPLLMATPLLSEGGEIMGILTVEKMPFLRFTPAAVKLFTLLGDWASSAFQRALKFEQTRDRNIEDELTGAYNYSYTLKRLNEEVLRARHYQVSLTLMAVGINDYGSIPPVKLPGVLRTLSLVFRRHIRPLDILGKHVSDGVFLIVVPHTNLKESTSLAARMSREVEAFGFKPFDDDRQLRVSVGLVPFTEEVASAETLLQETLQALQSRMQAALHESESNQ